MIEMTLREAALVAQAIDALPKLPNPKIAYHLGRIGDLIEPEVRQYQKQREKLIHEHGEKRESGEFQVKAENLVAFREADEALLEVKVQIQKERITLTDLLGSDPAKAPEIQPMLMRALGGRVISDE